MARPRDPEIERKAFAVMTRILSEVAAVVTELEDVPMDAVAIQALLDRHPAAPRVREITFRLAYERLPKRQQAVLGNLVASKLGLGVDARPAEIMAAVHAQACSPRGAARATTLSSYVERILRGVLSPAERRAAGKLLSEWDALRKAYRYYLADWRTRSSCDIDRTQDRPGELSLEHPACSAVFTESDERCAEPVCPARPFPHSHCQGCECVLEGGQNTYVDHGGGRFVAVGQYCRRCLVRPAVGRGPT